MQYRYFANKAGKLPDRGIIKLAGNIEFKLYRNIYCECCGNIINTVEVPATEHRISVYYCRYYNNLPAWKSLLSGAAETIPTIKLAIAQLDEYLKGTCKGGADIKARDFLVGLLKASISFETDEDTYWNNSTVYD